MEEVSGVSNNMNIPLIRKNTYKEYFLPVVVYGPILGIVISLVLLTRHDVGKAFMIGIPAGTGLTFLIQSFGFLVMELFLRKQQIKYCSSEKFKELAGLGIHLHEDLYFEGTYRNYYLKLIIVEQQVSKIKKINKFIVESYYHYPGNPDEYLKRQIDAANSGSNEFGNIIFHKHCAAFYLRSSTDPIFRESIGYMVGLMDQSGLTPIGKEEFQKLFIDPVKMKQKEEDVVRTIQILKIGKLDIKYVKPDRKK